MSAVTADDMLGKLKEAGVAMKLVEHEPAMTVEEWEPMHEKFEEKDSVLTKCLFMKDKKKQLYLLVALASTKTELKLFSKAMDSKEPRFAGEDILDEKLKVKKGAVNPFCIINDASSEVSLVLDDALLKATSLCFHPMDNSKTVILSNTELVKFFKHFNKEYKTVDFTLDASEADAPAKKDAKAPAKPKKEKAKIEAGVNTDGILVKKNEDFADWYQQVITKADLIEYYDISGCYILRPNAIGVWKEIVNFFDAAITEMGVEPCYFPMFVSKGALEREESHVEGFSAEVAWVTKSGTSDLQEPIAIRPTSETVMYPSFAKWIRSHRDLPLRLNQWCNVVRWEFSHPTPFIRTREFLWQEGHTAHETEEEAGKEVREILDLYAQVYEDLLAVPVIKGMKTEKEKFAGGKYTTTVEAFVPTVGRSVQGATSHCLGYGFAKMFNIKFEKDGKLHHPCQNSWGLTTRTLGVMIMVHSDDKGLVLPPRVAPVQCVFVPVGINAKTSAEDTQKVKDACKKLRDELKTAGVRSKIDDRNDKTSGNKCNHWEVRGVPIRIEVGPKEVSENTAMLCFRHTGNKKQVSLDDFAKTVRGELDGMQKELFQKAKEERDSRNVVLKTGEWDKFVPILNELKTCVVPFCGEEECEDAIKKDSAAIAQELAGNADVDVRAPSMGAKSLCIPDNQPKEEMGAKCFHPKCTRAPVKWTMFGRSY
eukprot:TRINITY_DN935_c0_g1_i1.p1 TRINITY_DN935_c0_g1~~TRINITY_DN935_c0_g1_i1.p1  ORF type:complete len:707 (+),score=336.51 TRINITY_DN935_c0_g1_i1:47-2167(+)